MRLCDRALGISLLAGLLALVGCSGDDTRSHGPGSTSSGPDHEGATGGSSGTGGEGGASVADASMRVDQEGVQATIAFSTATLASNAKGGRWAWEARNDSGSVLNEALKVELETLDGSPLKAGKYPCNSMSVSTVVLAKYNNVSYSADLTSGECMVTVPEIAADGEPMRVEVEGKLVSAKATTLFVTGHIAAARTTTL